MLDVLIVSYYGCDSVDDDVGDDLLLTAMNTTMSSTARLGRKTTRDDEFEQSRTALPKNLIVLSRSVSNSYTYRTSNQKLVCQDIKIVGNMP